MKASNIVTSKEAREYWRCHGETASRNIEIKAALVLKSFRESKNIPITESIPQKAAGILTPHSFNPNNAIKGTAEYKYSGVLNSERDWI